MKLKVCGLSNSIEVKACVDQDVNYCGYILNYPKSHRNISFEKAKILTDISKRNSEYVGVLVCPSKDELKKYSKLNFDYFQLYGEYDSKDLNDIRLKFKKKIISVIQVKKKDDVQKYKKVEKGSDIILWDSSGYENSLTWNYNWIKTISVRSEKMIAGNITIDKLENLSKLAGIVDVSGALETRYCWS